jgi:hypothetical protein
LRRVLAFEEASTMLAVDVATTPPLAKPVVAPLCKRHKYLVMAGVTSIWAGMGLGLDGATPTF